MQCSGDIMEGFLGGLVVYFNGGGPSRFAWKENIFTAVYRPDRMVSQHCPNDM
jgi:hypothetical protein